MISITKEIAAMNPKIKELEAKLLNAEDDEEKVDILNELAWELWTTDNRRSTQLTKESLELSQKLQYERGMAFSQLNEGLLVWQTDVEKSIPYFLDALEWFEEHEEKVGEAHVRGILGIIYWGFGDFERGFELANKALELYQGAQNTDGLGWAYNTLGAFHYDLKKYQQSLDYSQRGYAIFKKSGNRNGEARALNGMGNAYHYMCEYKKALDFQRRSLRISRQIGHRMSESRTLNDIGLIYQSLGNYPRALENHQKSLRIREDLDYPQGQSTTLMDLGNIYFEQGKYEDALKVFNKSLLLSEKLKSKPKIARAHSGLSKVYEKLNKFEQALTHHKKFHAIEEEVFHEDSDQKLKNMKTVYQIEASKKEAEIFRLRNVELREKNNQLEQTISELNATQAQLLQSGKMVALGNLVAGLVHEINTPIGTITSAADVLERIAARLESKLNPRELPQKFSAELQKLIRILQQNNQNSKSAADRIIKIIQSLKSFSRLDEAKFQKADIHQGLESVLTLLEHEIRQQIGIIKNYDNIPEIYCYPDEINQVFMNLLMNAVQATPEGGTITIKTYTENNHVCIKISDTGRGIPREKLEHLFEPGFTTDHSRVKMRTGLYTTYNIVHKHEGKITVESKVAKGTTFTVCISANLRQSKTTQKGGN
jgi:signal transduction histidine kinase